MIINQPDSLWNINSYGEFVDNNDKIIFNEWINFLNYSLNDLPLNNINQIQQCCDLLGRTKISQNDEKALRVYKCLYEKCPQLFKNNELKELDILNLQIEEIIPTNLILEEIKTRFENKFKNQLMRTFEIGKEIEKSCLYLNVDPQVSNDAGDHNQILIRNQITCQGKYFQLLRICNLVKLGPSIFEELQEKQFIGGLHHYESEKGLNTWNKCIFSLPTLFTELDTKDPQEALDQARELIIKFAKEFELIKIGNIEITAEDVAKQFPNRNLDLPENIELIPNIGQQYQDVYNHSICQDLRGNFFVNVPDFYIINFIFKEPFKLAEIAYKFKNFQEGQLYDQFCNELFDTLSYTCLNDQLRQMILFLILWDEKLNSLLNPEDTLSEKIEKGVFGEALKLKGLSKVMKEAKTRNDLIKLIDKYEIECNGQNFEEWSKIEKNKIRQIIINYGLWESVLYQREEGDDYFLLNEGTLNSFIADYHKYLDDSGL